MNENISKFALFIGTLSLVVAVVQVMVPIPDTVVIRAIFILQIVSIMISIFVNIANQKKHPKP